MTKTTAKTTRKTAAKKGAQFNMQAVHESAGVTADDAILASMLEGLGADDDTVLASDEIVEPSIELTADAAAPESDAAIIDINDTDAIEAAVAELKKVEANHALYEEEGEGAAVQADADKPAKAKNAKKEKEPKEPRVTYVTAGGKASKVLAYKLGEKKSELLLLDVADATLDAAALEAKQNELLSQIDGLAKKVGEKAVMLFSWMKTGGKLNEVMERAFRVLATEGELTSGDKGNLQTNLREKYSLGTARSQANQVFMLFPALGITMKEKGRMVPNPNSLIFMKAKAELGL